MSQLQPQELLLPQPQPQPQQQQPALVYPNNANKPPPVHHSNGSFGSVFIVLAVIVVLSAIACFLGRLCNRGDRAHKSKPNKQSKHKAGSNKSHPREGHHGDPQFGNQQHFQVNKGGPDIEFGFDKRIPTGKPSGPNYASRESRPGTGYINQNRPFVNVQHHDMKFGEMNKPGSGGGRGGGGSGRHDHVVIGEPREMRG